MAKPGTSASITEIIIYQLAEYFRSDCKRVRQVLEEFPEPNLRMEKPSISIYSPTIEFLPTARPYPLDKGLVEDNQSQVNWYVGDYDINIKIDLWAGNKQELDDLYNEVFIALNPKIVPMGVTLVLEEYFKQCATYLYIGHERVNDADSSRKDDWRITLDLLSTCNAVRSRKEYIIAETEIEEVEINTEVSI